MRNRIIAWSIAAICCLAGLPVYAADPSGVWLNQNKDAHIRIYNCGKDMCGTLLWLKEPNDPATGKPKLDKFNVDASKRARPILGILIVLDAKPTGTPNEWKGHVYNPEDGRTYSGGIALESTDSLKMQGCVLGGLFCKSEKWARIN